MTVVISIAETIIKYTVAPVGQWLCYSFKYNNNIENLEKQKKKLLDATERVKRSIDAASRNNEEIHEDVKTWLTNVDCIKEMANRILCHSRLYESEREAGMRSSITACLACQNLKQRHQLSREAKEIVENIAELIKDGNFAIVSYRPALQEMETPINMKYMAMKSRVEVVEGIMEALRSVDIYKIGVWGMPEMARQAREEGLFDEVVETLVTNSPVIRKIQGDIAFMLGLKFDEEANELGRASQLQRRLSKDKKILVILDDIWKELDLLEIGIPLEGCKVVMTSRDRDVLICGMGAQKEIELEILHKEDALKLFEMTAGEIVRNPDVRGTAFEIAEKCAGLPIALVTVSKALKNKNLSEWKVALRRLKSPAPEHITEMLKTIYSPIEVSYDSLESQELKSLFLLCAQLHNFLHYSDLLKYSYGYGLFHGANTLEEARDTLDTLLRKLKDSCLLLEDSNGFFMHDLVRDVATIIASRDNMFVMRDDGGDVDALKRCKAISVFYGDFDDQLPNEMECPELIFLFIDSEHSSLQIPDTLFQGMKKLKVLGLKRMRLSSLPSSLFFLRNLQTLCLDNYALEDISGIGELKNLVVLSLRHSTISKLPREIGSLVRLRLLDLSHCYKLKMIPPNVISSLVKLEELYMGNSYVQWEVEGLNDERKNASLVELKHLSNLTTLEIQIQDVSKLQVDFNFEKLERYKIRIGGVWHWFDNVQSSRKLQLEMMKSSIQSEFWNKMPLKRTEILHLEGWLNGVMSVIPEIESEGFQRMKYLRIYNVVELKYVVNLSTSVIVFPTLETFILSNMISLEEICQGNLPLTSFKNLKVLKVENCKKIRFIFSSSIAQGLSRLEELKITRCNNVGAIFVKEEEDGIEDQGDMMLFCRLQTLVLNDLPKLVGFLSTRETNSEGNLHDFQLPLLHDQVSFPSLQTLRMEGLPKIKHVWNCAQEPKTVFTGLEQLKILEIIDCGVEEIVAVEGGGEAVAIRTLVFPRVSTLEFRNLKRLKWFCKGVHVSKWPMLKEMKIERCEKVEIFASEVVSFEKAVKDQRQFEMSIKQPLFSVNELSFPSLKTLEIIWPDQVTATSFPNIPNANNLPANLLFEKLERCKICIGIKRYHPAYFMGENDFSRVFKLKLNMSFRLDLGIKMLLKRTEYLYLDEANSTKSVLYELHREDFQQLKFFHIQNNGNIKHILESGTSVVAFPILETFVLNNMFSLEEICQDKLPLSSFKNLKVLKVENCEKLKFIFSSSIARGLSLLEELNITRCDNLGAIFVKEEEDGIEDQGDIMLFGRLQTLVLNDLPMLVGFLSTKDSFMADCRETNSEGNHDLQLPLLHHDQVSFPSLQTLCMWGLPKIKYVWSCGQEPKTVFTCLEQLKILEISNCGVEEIVAVEGGGEAVAIRTLVFPRVSTLKFRYLKRLKWFYKGVHVSKWPMLKEMTIHGCHKVEIFASKVVSFEKAIEDQRQSEMSNIKQPLFSVDEHSFPSLETLEFWNMDSLEIIFGKLEGQNGKEPQVLISPALGTEESGATTQFASTGKLPLIYFKNLKVLKVENCQKLRFVSSSSIAKVPSLLEKLKIKRCNNMGAIVVAEDKDGIEDGDVILFHQLQTLELEDLPELVSFFSTKSSFMTDCGQIITEGNHNLHMPLLPHQLCFPSVRELYLEGLPKIKHVWSKEPQTMFRFQALQDIYVGKCESLTSLFPAWVLRCLEQLKKIVIEDCGVEEIVAVEGGGGEAVERTLVFPRVSTLELRNLKRLKWFCKRVHVSKWPMLKLMKIEGCEEVEIFASGVVSFEETIKERQSEMSIKQPLFLVDELSFPSLKKLYIWSLDKLEIIWQDQVTASSFPNIQELRISDCDKLLHVFQSNLHTTRTLIQSLTSLHIKDCDSLETIFRNMEGQSGKESQVLIAPSFGLEESIAREEETTRHIEFPTLTEMSLVGLPKLKWILEGVHTNLECPSLKQLELGGFGRVINMIWASKFPRSSSSQENQLQTCVQQPIFEFDEATFPNLEILSLRFSRTICPSRFSDFPAGPSFPIIRLPTLLELKVRSSGWEEIFSHELVDREIRLRRLSLNHLPMLIHLWKEDGTQPCPLSHNLQFLSLSGCGKLKNIVPSSVSLHNLRELAISDCHGLINLLTSSTAKTLVQLSRMTVTDCKRITEIVAMEDGEANVEITFKNLVCLELDGLPNLTHFCSRPYSFGFPSLIEVIVRCCPEMKTFCHGVLSTPELTAVWDDRHRWNSKRNVHWEDDLNTTTRCLWESNQYDTQCLFRERVENSEEDENHPSEDEDHSENSEEG